MNRLQNLKPQEKYHFLKSLLDKEEFLKFIESYAYFDKNYYVRFKVDFKLSENEFQNIPPRFWDEIYRTLDFDELEASNYLNWFYVSYEAVKNDVIKPYYFAFTKQNKDGIKNITRALREYKSGKTKFLDDLFRAVLRRMFGFIKERGRKGIYQDVPFSIAWWKEHIYLISTKYTDNSKIKEYLYFNDTFYKELVLKMGFTLTLLAERKLLSAMLDYSSTHEIKNKKKFIQKISTISSIRSYGALDFEEIKNIIKGL